jgi:hypothetical protein
MYWNDERQTRRGCCDSPNARITRAYLVPCDQLQRARDEISAELVSLGFPRPVRVVFPDTASDEWHSGPIPASVTTGQIDFYFDTYAGATLPKSMFPDVDFVDVEKGCSLQYVIAVGTV